MCSGVGGAWERGDLDRNPFARKEKEGERILTISKKEESTIERIGGEKADLHFWPQGEEEVPRKVSLVLQTRSKAREKGGSDDAPSCGEKE